MELFVKMSNSCNPLTIFTKRSIINVCQVSKYASEQLQHCVKSVRRILMFILQFCRIVIFSIICISSRYFQYFFISCEIKPKRWCTESINVLMSQLFITQAISRWLNGRLEFNCNGKTFLHFLCNTSVFIAFLLLLQLILSFL